MNCAKPPIVLCAPVMIVTRFAPSPTGRLHVGNVRTGLLNWLLAKKLGGKFMLRLDDTDTARSTEAYAQSIRDDLAWLGMNPDGEVKQSERLERYAEVLQQLAASGHVYRAYETPEELDLKRKVLAGRGLPPVYDRAALALTDADHARFEAEGRKPHWRFRLSEDAPHMWEDLVRGPSRIDPASLSDPIIRRADGSWLYMLPSVIDDVDMGMTHVIRGEDHVTNTGVQLQMFAAMNAPAPVFGHAPLLTGTEGKLSKRLGSIGVDDFRNEGIEAITVKSFLSRLGSSLAVEPFTDDAPLIEAFDLAHLGRSTPRFDEAELRHLNSRILHQMPYADVVTRTSLTHAEWDAVKGNIESVGEADSWKPVFDGNPDIPAADPADVDFLRMAADALSGIEADADGWNRLTSALKDSSGRKGKALFMPLRKALTGREHGPDMAVLLPLIGRERALERLRAVS